MENNLIKADYTTMPRMFDECNLKYFNHSLPRPKYGLMRKKTILAGFQYSKDKGKKHPIKWQKILFSECYDYTEEEFRNLMVHEMIHYYIAWNNIKDNKTHGNEFMKMAEEMNVKYGLNITKYVDPSTYHRNEKESTYKGIFPLLMENLF